MKFPILQLGGGGVKDGKLTGRVFRRVIIGYVALAFFLTLGQLIWEYVIASRNVSRDLGALGQSFAPGITDALWNYQDELLKAMVAGIRQNPVVTGVMVEKRGGVVAAAEGRLPAQIAAGEWQFLPPYQAYVAPLEYNLGTERDVIGRLVIVSDFEIVKQRVVASFQTSVMIAAVNAALLWLLFYLVITQTVSRPLARLSRLVAAADKEVGAAPLVYAGDDEIGILVEALNGMRARLAASHRELEAKVEERTQELQTLAGELRLLSTKDALTGCFNRRNMEERLGTEIARSRRYGLHLSLVLCDIDRFKTVNDTYGHATGDHVLRDFAQLLMAGVRQDVDWVVRFGGEEFLVVLPETPVAGAVRLMERFRQGFAERPMAFNDQRFHVTASFGVVSIDGATEDPIDATGLLAAADQALYRAKTDGRNRVAVAASP
jgi:diguanylate cyclase (GGDEF)-like protein